MDLVHWENIFTFTVTVVHERCGDMTIDHTCGQSFDELYSSMENSVKSGKR